MNRNITLLVVFALLCLLVPNADAATRCVNKTGLDSNNGTCDFPWLTVKKAMQTVVPNDFVYIDSGEYLEEVIASNSLQTADDNITYQGIGLPIIRLVNATCNRVIDVVNNNNTFDGLVIDGNGTLDTCEFGIFIRNNRNTLTVKNSIIKNVLGASAQAITIETSGVAASNNATIYNNSLINNQNQVIDLNGGNQNYTNITGNYIEVGRVNTDTGIFGSTSNGGASYNLTIENNIFNYTNVTGNEANAILLQRTTNINGSFGIRIINNTFGQFDRKWEGTTIRLVRINESNVSNNMFWINDTTANNIVWYEGQNDNITLTNNLFCNATEFCSATGNPFQIEDGSNVQISNNSIYYNRFGGDGLYAESTSRPQANLSILSNYIYIHNITGTTHVIGSGSEGNGSVYSNVYIAHNIVNISSTAGAGASHNIFMGTTLNGTGFNNTIYRGTYGILTKFSNNITYNSNYVYNITDGAMYDKGSNFTLFKNNFVQLFENTSQAAYTDGTAFNLTTNHALFYNNTFFYPPHVNASAIYAVNLGQFQINTTTYNNTFRLPYQSYKAFINYTTAYNYRGWQATLIGQENGSIFYPVDSITLNAPISGYYNGISYNWTPNLTGIGYANATFYMNFSNGTSYINQSNGTAINNLVQNTLLAYVNLTTNFTWNVCFNDTNAFQICSTSASFIFANTSLTNTIIHPINGTIFNGSTTYIITINSTSTTIPLSQCTFNVDNGINTTYTCNTNITNSTLLLAHGIHNISAYTTDINGGMIGNVSYFYVDRFGPTIVINNPLNNSVQTSNVVLLNTTITDNRSSVSSCLFSLNGNANSSYNCSTLNILAETGSNQLIIYAIDSVGNINSTGTFLFTAQAVISCTYQYKQILTNVTLTQENKRITYKDEVLPQFFDYSLLFYGIGIIALIGGVFLVPKQQQDINVIREIEGD